MWLQIIVLKLLVVPIITYCNVYSESVGIFSQLFLPVPSVPVNLTVDSLNSTAINISWSEPADPNGILLHYNVYLEEEADGILMVLEMRRVQAIQGVKSYSLPIYDLFAFTLYGIQVSAETRIGEGPRTEVEFVTDPDSASPPSFVSVEPLNSTAIQLSWGYPDTPRGNITGYTIFHNTSTNDVTTTMSQFNLTLSPINDRSNQTHVIAGLTPFTYYQFRVGAFAETEEETHYGLPSDPVVARTDEDSKTSIPASMYIYLCACIGISPPFFNS